MSSTGEDQAGPVVTYETKREIRENADKLNALADSEYPTSPVAAELLELI